MGRRDKKSFQPKRTTEGQSPGQEWLLNANISEFADRAAEEGLKKLRRKLKRGYGRDAFEFSDVHWAGDRWRLEITYGDYDVVAMIGWVDDQFQWVLVDKEGGYKNLNRMAASEPVIMAAIELYDAFDKWYSQIKLVRRKKSSCRRCGRHIKADAEDKAWADYPKKAVENARKVLGWIDKHGREEVDGATRIGLERANQLDNGEELSENTIERMHSFFERHDGNQSISEEHKDEPWKDNGYVAWLAWGGDAAFQWAEDKLKQIEQDD